MLKYIASIALACSCIASSAAADDNSYAFDFWRFDRGESLPSDPWYKQGYEFVSGNKYSYSFTDNNGNTRNYSLTWSDGVTIGQNGATSAQFHAPSTEPSGSTLTFDFGGMTVDEISFTVYGLEGYTNDKGVNIGGLFKIMDVNPRNIYHNANIPGTTDPNNNFENLEELTSASGYGSYQRTDHNNANDQAVVVITIYQPKNKLTLYFESQAYQISDLKFQQIAQTPEPATYAALLGLAIAGIAIVRRRRKA